MTRSGPPAIRAGATLGLLAPAKINLGLEVVGRRPDGYHELRTVMQAVDLVDHVEITLDPHGEGIALAAGDEWRASGERGDPQPPAPVPLGPTNLAWRAACAFQEAIGEPPLGAAEGTPWLHLRITKRIPVGAGLGGGSADAGATLLGLNLLHGRPLGASALAAAAASVGADVPFALAGGTCFGVGRGERLRRLPSLPPLAILVVAPRLPVATPWAYTAWDAEALTGQRGSASILESAIRQRSRSRIAGALWNDLEAVVGRRYGVVEEIRRELLDRGALGARMSGSGSAVFALVDGDSEALQIAGAIRHLQHPVFVCRPSPEGCRPSA
jgi:4-diphosphocytidyl-2-C-methyl-D-erythritol kinase